MDPQRRRLLVSLALSPALTSGLPASLLRAAHAEDGPMSLKASVVAAGSEAPPLRYGDEGSAPILRVKRDARVRIGLDNRLPGPTGLDLHGIRVPSPLGGMGPLGGRVAPGTAAEIAFTPPDSGTFWFHPWITDPKADDTARGLSGVILVEKPVPPEVDVDLVALLTDGQPMRSNAVDQNPAETLRIDGGAGPRSEVLRPGSRVRLRIVNGSTRQAVSVSCRGARPSVVAIDGQPSELFTPRGDTVPLGPGARCDLLLDMPRLPGTEVSLAVRGSDPGVSEVFMMLRAEGDVRDARGRIVALPTNPRLPRTIALEAATRAILAVAMMPGVMPGEPAAWSVNGASGVDLPKEPLFKVKRGAPVTLTFTNASPRLVAFRIHGFAMRILHDLDDGWEPYWRDSILVPPGATHHAAFVADLPGDWLIESPFFDQAAWGLRGWFEVS